MHLYGFVIDHLIEKGRLDQAEELLEEIGKDKPNLREYDNHYQIEKRHYGYTSSQKRYDVYKQWKPYYKAVWKLREARRGK